MQANSEQCSHFIFEGKPGVGKRTMIWALLREAFGADKVQVQGCIGYLVARISLLHTCMLQQNSSVPNTVSLKYFTVKRRVQGVRPEGNLNSEVNIFSGEQHTQGF